MNLWNVASLLFIQYSSRILLYRLFLILQMLIDLPVSIDVIDFILDIFLFLLENHVQPLLKRVKLLFPLNRFNFPIRVDPFLDVKYRFSVSQFLFFEVELLWYLFLLTIDDLHELVSLLFKEPLVLLVLVVYNGSRLTIVYSRRLSHLFSGQWRLSFSFNILATEVFTIQRLGENIFSIVFCGSGHWRSDLVLPLNSIDSWGLVIGLPFS